MTESDIEDPEIILGQIGKISLGILVFLGVLASGIGIWQWASTKPELVIGEDIPAEAVLLAMTVVVLLVAGVGTIFITRRIRQFQAAGSETADSSESAESRKRNQGTDSESEKQSVAHEEERDPDPTSEAESRSDLDDGVVDTSKNISEPEAETDITFSDGPAPDNEEASDPNRNGPEETRDSSGRPSGQDIDDKQVRPAEREEAPPEVDKKSGDIRPADRAYTPSWMKRVLQEKDKK